MFFFRSQLNLAKHLKFLRAPAWHRQRVFSAASARAYCNCARTVVESAATVPSLDVTAVRGTRGPAAKLGYEKTRAKFPRAHVCVCVSARGLEFQGTPATGGGKKYAKNKKFVRRWPAIMSRERQWRQGWGRLRYYHTIYIHYTLIYMYINVWIKILQIY